MLLANPARAALLRGVEQIARLTTATYGPVPGVVAVDRLVAGGPEVLDSAATIARRTIALPDPFENAGAMLARNAVLTVQERVGDGGGLTLLLCATALREAQRCIAAGWNPVRVRTALECGLQLARATLRAQARPLRNVKLLAGLMEGLVRDQRLAALLTEVVDAVGGDGVVLVESGQGTETTREYLDGVVWQSGFVSSYFADEGSSRARVVDPALLISDSPVERVEDLVPCLERCLNAGLRRLVVIAPRISDAAVGILLANRTRGVLEGALAIRPPSDNGQCTDVLEDLAALTGGVCVRAAAGDRVANVRAEQLGRARQVWASSDAFGVLGAHAARGPAARDRALAVRGALAAGGADAHARGLLQRRLANLAGTGAIVRVAAPTDAERDALREEVEAAVRAGGLALRQGVVPGGGAALLACIPTLQAGADAYDAVALRVLAAALSAPMRAIAESAGRDGAAIVAEARERGAGWTFDALRGCWVEPFEAGPIDAYGVIAAALEIGISTAASGIVADAVVRERQPRSRRRP